jgi:pimeloyl-ACP methyl ester carboxylesterase
MAMRYLILIVLASIFCSRARGEDPVRFPDEVFPFSQAQPLTGRWIGNIKSTIGQFVAAIDIDSAADHSLTASVNCLQFGAFSASANVQSTASGSATLSFESQGMLHTWTLHTDAGAQRLSGTMVIHRADDPNSKALDEGTIECARSQHASELPGAAAYTGTIGIAGAASIKLTIVLAKTSGNHWIGQVDLPAQNLREYPLVNIQEKDSEITAHMPIPRASATIEARIENNGEKLVGHFKQAGYDLAMDFARDANYELSGPRRPQNPKPPYPYQSREIVIEASAMLKLAGTLTIPQGDGPFPAAVLITGSGQQDRDESLMGHKPFLVLADYLTRHGVAVLRCDDRGVGGSGGGATLEQATSSDFAGDVGAMVDFLKTQSEIDARRIGLIGHSEGGLIAPMLASQRQDIAFVVLLAGPGVTGADILRVQGAKILEAQGTSEAAAAEYSKAQSEVLSLVSQGESEEKIRAAITEAVHAISGNASAASQAADHASSQPDSQMLKAQVDAQYHMITLPWMKFFISYDPRPALAKVKCPVLAMNGTLDLQVSHEQNLPEIEKAVHSGGGDITIKRYEKLNHLFQPAKTGNISEYAEIETTFDEQAMSDIIQWLRARKLLN